MNRLLAAVRAAWARYRAAADERSARAFHHAMGHSCSFCQPRRGSG
jgi:hypothetical protein